MTSSTGCASPTKRVLSYEKLLSTLNKLESKEDSDFVLAFLLSNDRKCREAMCKAEDERDALQTERSELDQNRKRVERKESRLENLIKDCEALKEKYVDGVEKKKFNKRTKQLRKAKALFSQILSQISPTSHPTLYNNIRQFLLGGDDDQAPVEENLGTPIT